MQTEKFLRQPAVELPTLELNGVQVDSVELADDLKTGSRSHSSAAQPVSAPATAASPAAESLVATGLIPRL